MDKPLVERLVSLLENGALSEIEYSTGGTRIRSTGKLNLVALDILVQLVEAGFGNAFVPLAPVRYAIESGRVRLVECGLAIPNQPLVVSYTQAHSSEAIRLVLNSRALNATSMYAPLSPRTQPRNPVCLLNVYTTCLIDFAPWKYSLLLPTPVRLPLRRLSWACPHRWWRAMCRPWKSACRCG